MSTWTARRIAAVAALAGGALLAAGSARASDVHWSVGISAPLYPGHVSTVISNGRYYAPPPPVYVRPAPIYYYAPPPVYYRPAPVYHYPAPVVVYRHGPPHHGYWHHRHHDRWHDRWHDRRGHHDGHYRGHHDGWKR
jgi:hypothetical protein